MELCISLPDFSLLGPRSRIFGFEDGFISTVAIALQASDVEHQRLQIHVCWPVSLSPLAAGGRPGRREINPPRCLVLFFCFSSVPSVKRTSSSRAFRAELELWTSRARTQLQARRESQARSGSARHGSELELEGTGLARARLVDSPIGDGGDEVVGGLQSLCVSDGGDQPVAAVDGGDTQGNHNLTTSLALKTEVINRGAEIAQETDLLSNLNEELKAKMASSQNDILGILETTIDIKKMFLARLKRLHNAMELSYAMFKEGNRMLHKASTEDSSSMLVDELVAEKRDVSMKVDDEMSKQLEKEVAKLDAEIHGQMEKLNELLGLGDESECYYKDLISALVAKSFVTSDELKEARVQLIKVFNDMPTTQRRIGIKLVGELNPKPFIVACQGKYVADEFQVRAQELISVWQEKVKNPSWHPFRIVEVDGIMKQVVDDSDADLTRLREEYGEDVCNAVKVALAEINESGGFLVAELWNFSEGRRATVNEALKEVCRQLSKSRKRRLQN